MTTLCKTLKNLLLNRPLSRKLLRGDTDSVVVVGVVESGAKRPIPLPLYPLQHCHFDWKEKPAYRPASPELKRGELASRSGQGWSPEIHTFTQTCQW